MTEASLENTSNNPLPVLVDLVAKNPPPSRLFLPNISPSTIRPQSTTSINQMMASLPCTFSELGDVNALWKIPFEYTLHKTADACNEMRPSATYLASLGEQLIDSCFAHLFPKLITSVADPKQFAADGDDVHDGDYVPVNSSSSSEDEEDDDEFEAPFSVSSTSTATSKALRSRTSTTVKQKPTVASSATSKLAYPPIAEHLLPCHNAAWMFPSNSKFTRRCPTLNSKTGRSGNLMNSLPQLSCTFHALLAQHLLSHTQEGHWNVNRSKDGGVIVIRRCVLCAIAPSGDNKTVPKEFTSDVAYRSHLSNVHRQSYLKPVNAKLGVGPINVALAQIRPGFSCPCCGTPSLSSPSVFHRHVRACLNEGGLKTLVKKQLSHETSQREDTLHLSGTLQQYEGHVFLLSAVRERFALNVMWWPQVNLDNPLFGRLTWTLSPSLDKALPTRRSTPIDSSVLSFPLSNGFEASSSNQKSQNSQMRIPTSTEGTTISAENGQKRTSENYTLDQFVCELCNGSVASMECLSQHLQLAHPEACKLETSSTCTNVTDCHVCSDCSKRFYTRVALWRHRQLSAEDLKLSGRSNESDLTLLGRCPLARHCRACRQQIVLSHVYSHWRRRHPQLYSALIASQVCLYCCNSPSLLPIPDMESHLELYHNVKKDAPPTSGNIMRLFSCPQCTLCFVTPFQRRNHMLLAEHTYQCCVCIWDLVHTSQDGDDNVEDRQKESVFRCEEPVELQRHMFLYHQSSAIAELRTQLTDMGLLSTGKTENCLHSVEEWDLLLHDGYRKCGLCGEHMRGLWNFLIHHKTRHKISPSESSKDNQLEILD